MSACLENETPQKLSLAFLPMCQHRRGTIFMSVQHVQNCMSDAPPVQSLLEAKREDVSKRDVNASSD